MTSGPYLDLSLLDSNVSVIKAMNSEILRTEDSSFLHYRVATDNETLSEIVTMITAMNSDLDQFQPSLAVISTWELIDSTFLDQVSLKLIKYCSVGQ